ncbi:MAG: hypothetical protein RL701_4528 [Pseudomonadota bacterium]|jgi:hypothetical protein
MTLPTGVDWWFHRILVSEFYKVSINELHTQWSFEDVCDAHLMIDALLADRAAAQRESENRR